MHKSRAVVSNIYKIVDKVSLLHSNLYNNSTFDLKTTIFFPRNLKCHVTNARNLLQISQKELLTLLALVC